VYGSGFRNKGLDFGRRSPSSETEIRVSNFGFWVQDERFVVQGSDTVLNLRKTTLQKFAVVPRRARI